MTLTNDQWSDGLAAEDDDGFGFPQAPTFTLPQRPKRVIPTWMRSILIRPTNTLTMILASADSGIAASRRMTTLIPTRV